MMQLNAYLTFNGNCREAMTFYQSCLGGELSFQTIAVSPLLADMPERMKSFILQATLTKGALLLMGSDMVGEQGLIKGNRVALFLNCSSEAAIRTCYEKLSAGGVADHQLEENFWGILFGDLTDKFGHQWILQYNKKV
ncbi:MAG: VOC family protein [Flavobacterium sp.]|nr:MAG: VOC family protein [Flavobacterium sp.]